MALNKRSYFLMKLKITQRLERCCNNSFYLFHCLLSFVTIFLEFFFLNDEVERNFEKFFAKFHVKETGKLLKLYPGARNSEP